MGNSLILEEEEGDISGDGKFSGIPKFEMMASLGNFETLNFQTLGKIRNDATHEMTKSKMAPNRRFLSTINNLLPEEKKPKIPERQKVSWQKLRNIRNTPIKVKLIDIETGEEKIFPSIYRTAKYLDKSPQTIRHYGNRKGVWKKKISGYNGVNYLCA